MSEEEQILPDSNQGPQGSTESQPTEPKEPQEFQARVDLRELSSKVYDIKHEIGKKLVGQSQLIDMILTGILADGHLLLEGVPGVAKTYTAKLTAKVINAVFSRIQFTPDLMPSDVTGTSIFNAKSTEFEFKPGPIFGNVVLIDEINRAPAKTQAALFECMEEKQISIDGNSHELDFPFIVLATQNPVEHEGTYRLPEAQLDRFLFKVSIDYPSLDEEVKILEGVNNQVITHDIADMKPLMTKDDLKKFREQAKQVRVEPNQLKYIAKLVEQTRSNANLFLGASPRASIGILNASKAYAAINGRDFVVPDDIRFVTYPVLNHRIVLTPEREMEGITTNDVIKEILEQIEVPR